MTSAHCGGLWHFGGSTDTVTLYIKIININAIIILNAMKIKKKRNYHGLPKMQGKEKEKKILKHGLIQFNSVLPKEQLCFILFDFLNH